MVKLKGGERLGRWGDNIYHRKDGRWEYRFFVDVEGNLDDAAVQNALRGVKEESAFMRVLGNFEA